MFHTTHEKQAATQPQPSQLASSALLDAGVPPYSALIETEFAIWQTVIESLPLCSAEFCFAINWLNSARALWMKGDMSAAQYQLKIIAKKFGLAVSTCV